MFFSGGKLTYKWVGARNSDARQFISKYTMLVAFKSPDKLSKCFLSVKFRTNFEVVQQKQFLSVVANWSLEIRLFYRNSGTEN